MNWDSDRRDVLLAEAFARAEAPSVSRGTRRGWQGGIRRFRGVSAALLRQLVEEGFCDGGQESPNAEEVLSFLEACPSFTAHGYAVHPGRRDYRVVLEGVIADSTTASERLRFIRTWRYLEDSEVTETGACYAWFD